MTGESREMRNRPAHWLDHDFLNIDHGVHRDPEGLRADPHDHRQWLRRAVALRRGRETQQFGQTADRQHFVAQLQDFRALHKFDFVLAAVEPDRLDHRMLRQGETLAAGLDDQRRGDGQRQRNLQGETAALSGL